MFACFCLLWIGRRPQVAPTGIIKRKCSQNKAFLWRGRWHAAGVTEGEKAIYIKFSLSLPQSFFKRKMTAPSSEGTYVVQPQGLSLRFVVVCTVSFATAFCCFSLTMQLLLFRKNHAWLACSVVNALTTAHCRYQLLRIFILLSAVNYIYQQ